MCGICGKYNFKSKRQVGEDDVLKMVRTLIHRGPDDEGYYVDNEFGFGMRRLSIIDLEGGHQPIENEDGSLSIILNGEIYNYREIYEELKHKHKFKTKSDTEVILHAYEEYGVKCLEKFNGMYAFAIYERNKRNNGKLFLARDRLGVKPLFYSISKDGINFGSEIKAILCNKEYVSKVNMQSLSNFLSLGYVPGQETLFKDIYQLLPGYYLLVENGAVSLRQYWDIKYNNNNNFGRSESYYLNSTLDLLKSAVEYRLVSDVPMGIFLSAGLDSNSILYFMKQLYQGKIKAFTVGYEDKDFTEIDKAAFSAKYFDIEHETLLFTPKDLIDNFPIMIEHSENLSTLPSFIPHYLLSKKASKTYKVVLSGGGGDELFLGYPTYWADYYYRYYSKIPLVFREKMISSIVKLIPNTFGKVGIDYKIKKFTEVLDASPEMAHYLWRTIFTEEEKSCILKPDIIAQISDTYLCYEPYISDPKLSHLNIIDRGVYADLKVWLTYSGLLQSDHLGMANGLEMRFPFLDYRLVEFVLNIPFKYRFKLFKNKYLLKKMMKNKLPDEIKNRKKEGFHIPIGRWINNELREFVLDSLNEKKINQIGYFNYSYIRGLLKDHQEKKADNSFKIWNLLCFVHWHDMYMGN